MIFCRLCKTKKLKKLIDFGCKPIVNFLLNSPNVIYSKYPFKLSICDNCQLQQIEKPISDKILYNNYNTPSTWKNEPHINSLIFLIKIYVQNKKSKILDIGCNDGKFLKILKKEKFKKITGIEPTINSYNVAKKSGLKVFNGYFKKSEKYFKFLEKKYDVIIFRQVLEHIKDLNNFMNLVSTKLANSGLIIIEVPDHESSMLNLDYALWEEHVNYFTLSSLENLLIKCNFKIIYYEYVLFSGKTLRVIAEKRKSKKTYLENINAIKKYKKCFKLLKQKIHLTLNKKKFLVYGAGARSQNFINLLELDKIKFFYDDNHHKIGKFVPGYNVKIKKFNKNELKEVDYVLLGVNTENENLIINKLTPPFFIKKKSIKYFSILPPSLNLPPFWKKLINS